MCFLQPGPAACERQPARRFARIASRSDARGHDQRHAERRGPPARGRSRGEVGIYACGPTTYGPIHIGNARPYVVFSLLRRFLAHEGYDADARHQPHRRQRQDLRRRPRGGVPSAEHAERMIAAYVADTDALGLGRPDHEPKATETIGPIVALIEDLVDSGHAYESSGDVYFRVRSFPAYGQLSNRDTDADGPGRGGRQRRAQGGPARLRALEGAQGGRGHVLAEPLGRRPSRLAHRVLGDGRGSARARVRDPRRRLRPRLPAPRERARPDRGRARAPAGEDLDAQRDGRRRGRRPARPRRWRSRSATSSCSARRSRRSGPRPSSASSSPATTASRSRFGEGALEEAAARNQRIREFFREGEDPPGEPAPAVLARREAFLDALADDFNTPRALAELFGLLADARREPLPGARRVAARAARAARPRVARRRRGGGEGAAEAERLLAERERARAERDFARADEIRDRLAELGWEVRDTAERRTARPPRVLSVAGARADLRPQPGPRGAARPPPGPPGLDERRHRRRRADQAGGLARPPGDRRRGRSLSVRRPGPLLAADDSFVVALDQVQDPRNLGAICRTRRGRRRGRRRSSASAGRRRSRPRPARRRRARSSTCRSRGSAT